MQVRCRAHGQVWPEQICGFLGLIPASLVGDLTFSLKGPSQMSVFGVFSLGSSISPKTNPLISFWKKWIGSGVTCLLGEGNGTPLQYSCLENPMDGGAWWAAVHGVARSWTQLSDFTSTFHFHALEKEMATHSSVLAWRIPGTGKPGGLPSMGSHRVGHDWSNLAAAVATSLLKLRRQHEWRGSGCSCYFFLKIGV